MAIPTTAASTTASTSTAPQSTTSTTQTYAPVAPPALVSQTTVDAWARVRTCEEGGRDDPNFGYYGIYPSSWLAYGGGQFSSSAGGATLVEQTYIAVKIDGGYVPDGSGCAAW